jgi:cell division protein FtsB
MFQSRRSKKRFRLVLFSALGALVVGYFLFHTVQGDRGWLAMLRMSREIGSAETTLSGLKKEREELENATRRLRGESLDPDLLEEKSRELLNYSKPNEIVILTPQEKENEAK